MRGELSGRLEAARWDPALYQSATAFGLIQRVHDAAFPAVGDVAPLGKQPRIATRVAGGIDDPTVAPGRWPIVRLGSSHSLGQRWATPFRHAARHRISMAQAPNICSSAARSTGAGRTGTTTPAGSGSTRRRGC